MIRGIYPSCNRVDDVHWGSSEQHCSKGQFVSGCYVKLYCHMPIRNLLVFWSTMCKWSTISGQVSILISFSSVNQFTKYQCCVWPAISLLCTTLKQGFVCKTHFYYIVWCHTRPQCCHPVRITHVGSFPDADRFCEASPSALQPHSGWIHHFCTNLGDSEGPDSEVSKVLAVLVLHLDVTIHLAVAVRPILLTLVLWTIPAKWQQGVMHVKKCWPLFLCKHNLIKQDYTRHGCHKSNLLRQVQG